MEQTLSIIKPDAVERNLIQNIKDIFTKNNLKIKESKKIKISKDEAAEFYKVHQSSFLQRSMYISFIWSNSGYDFRGENAVLANRKIMGATNPKDAEENTIRKLYGISIDKNSVHGSDSIDNAKKEIDFFFDL